MRPVRLVIQAFGPYAGRQSIDFREAVAAGLFGIYGQTGSGKSTIFSAMTFALFGEAARAEQDTISLRSDHASSEMATEVEFVFDLGARRYVIRRRPEQMRPKQRGGGETRDAHEAWLFDATGLGESEITATQPGKVLAEKKIGLVREKITDLLGYGPEQFKQIVLLPQGRFEAFLSAKTQERQDILSALFDVSLYRRLAAKLKNDAESAERLVREERAVWLRRLGADGFDSMQALVDGIAEAASSLTERQQAEVHFRAEADAARAALQAARAADSLFKAMDTARQARQKNLDRATDMAALQMQITAAERARTLTDTEDRVIEAQRDCKDAEAALSLAMQIQTSTQATAQQAQAAYQQQLQSKSEIEALRRTIDQLERDRDVLEKATGLTASVEAAKRRVQEEQAAFRTAEAGLAELTGKRHVREQTLKQARLAHERRQSLTVNLTALQAQVKQAEIVERAEKDLQQARQQLNHSANIHAERQAQAISAAALFDQAERQLASAQALHLAAKLAPGLPCPVCGATDHPAPAMGDSAEAGLDKAFREAKQTLEKARLEEQHSATAHASAQATVDERQGRLADLERPERQIPDLRQDMEYMEHALRGLGPAIDIAAAETALENLGKAITDAQARLDQHRDRLAALTTETSNGDARLAEMLSGIAMHLRDRATLERNLQQSKALMTSRETALKRSEEDATATREAALSAQKDSEAAENILTERQARFEKENQGFEDRLRDAGLTRDDLNRLKPAITTLERDKATIEDHQRQLRRDNEKLMELETALAGKHPPDLLAHQEALSLAEAAFDTAVTKRAATAARLDHLQNLQQELAGIAKRLDEAEATSGPLRELASLFDAQNRQKLKLETFAIGAMFEQVLQAANLRLGPMTNGRYRLERDIESGGRGKRGLGILAFDIHTGKARPTATLSGGETFIAALALALGLADVVESASGKVRLDTIFLDEGFGSLDTENGSGTLDLVLQALNSLASQNRTVGLISHVPLVQEAIPNGFYVRKDSDGSHVEARGMM
ncbi:nuclease SbcCD subunit C [Agrobacterium vitis]|uniref:AAA family ATPase n=1 Tax=Agrobacterium vitis TaxID=373 RepID=UPI0015D7810F|nr:AAA family ATPase [Agrobacterium vitis]BCH58210.1 nuclease SbcCD subunit C [Agrobacterium vitis]